MRKRILGILLCLCLLLGAAGPAFAAETQEEVPRCVTISTVKKFLSFAESCRLDSYSRDLEVKLTADLDLSGVEFSGIPSFSGTFDGNGHTISGLDITSEGSTLGLFRYLTETAVVQNLTVQGRVAPEGSRSQVGGIAGSNAGTISGCTFEGEVSGGDNVGGLVGVNTVSGILENCRTQGIIHGNHFVGGMAGKNSGVIRSCTNRAEVNSTAQENTVSLSDITMESLINSESASTVTDIGGIAGNNSGVIRQCLNLGAVGYQHMGYNIGGIAGTQNGYILDCENRAQVLGRKEVGGIVGQMEPTALVEYEEDALQILQKQLSAMGSTVSRTAANVQSTGEAIYGQVGALYGQVVEASDAVGLLIPSQDNPELPDADTVQAARNALSGSLYGMEQTLQGMSTTTQSAVGTLSNNLHTLQSQVSAMSATLGNVSQTMGGSIEDVSDRDTAGDLNGKVEQCVNNGAVLGDLNVGGITGAIALENDLDPEDDWQIQGNNSLNFESQLRAVILNCENNAEVTAGKRCAGGIVGWQSLGLVKESQNTGSLEGGDGQYIGGISGQSTGYIRNCSAKCTLTGKSSVGGIAGSASIVTDCRSMVELSGAEKLGAVLGGTENNTDDEVENPIAGNYYLTVSKDLGGIDGISYDGLAQPLSEADFLSLENLPELFGNVKVTFLFADGSKRQFTVPSGGSLNASQLPAIPEKEGYTSRWEGLEEADLSNIVFNLSFEAQYIRHLATLQSDAQEDGMPVLLVQGDFTEEARVAIAELDTPPELAENQALVQGWTLSLTEPEGVTTGRLRLGSDGETLSLLLRSGDGTWRQVETEADGSYLVFALTGGDDALALIREESASLLVPTVAGALALALVLLALAGFRKRQAKKKPKQS